MKSLAATGSISARNRFTDIDNAGIVLLAIRIRLPAANGGVLLGHAWQAGRCAEYPKPKQGQNAACMRVYGSVKRWCCLVANHASGVETFACCLLYFSESRSHFRDASRDDDAFGLRKGQPVNAGRSYEWIGEIKYQRRGELRHAGLN